MGLLAMSSGCATVAVLENVVESEISLTASQSELHRASDVFCETSKDAKWATGESSFSYLMRLWDGDVKTGQAYWETLNELEPTSSDLVELIGFDVKSATSQLKYINGLAQKLLPSQGADQKPKKTDVNEFERVLIHAGQSRETFDAAFGFVADDGSKLEAKELTLTLKPLDEELQLARDIADGLAAARMSDVLAELEEQANS